jgi:Tfp pilus assembly protein PilV
MASAGFSLVEVLIASTLALIAMASVATLFGIFGRTVSQSQTIVDLNARLRSAASQLRQDLHGVTAPTKPWIRPEANAGYFEIVEGTSTDSTPAGTMGDADDRLMCTTKAFGKPFTGSLQGTTAIEGYEAPFAEIAWFCESSGQTFEGKALYNLYRRQLLVAATPGAGRFASGVSASIDRNLTDLSCRDVSTNKIANSLSDLSKPANRFWTVVGAVKTLQGDRLGEDVILTNVIAFDIRGFAPASSSYADQSFNTNYAENATPTAGDSLRGLEIRIRCVEPSSRQIRQVTVVHSFEGL